MINMSYFFNKEDLAWLFEKWTSEAEEYAKKKAKFDEYMRRLEETAIPFKKKQEELLQQKRKRDSNAYLTTEERDEIWLSFREVRRRIESELYED